jgi:hypothetical protein
MVNGLYDKLRLPFLSWMNTLASLRPPLLAPGRGQLGKTPFTTVEVTKKYFSPHHDNPGDTHMGFIAWFKKGTIFIFYFYSYSQGL